MFWGRDAATAAAASAAPDLGEGQYGWLDRPVEEAVELGTAVEELRETGELRFATDFRPHSHHHQMMAKVRAAPTESGTLTIGDAKMCAFMTSWGDGIFPVEIDRDSEGSILTVRLVMATEETLGNMRVVNAG